MEPEENAAHLLSPVEEVSQGEPSVVDLIKKDFQSLLESEDVYIHVVGYESSKLQIKYRMPESGKELDTLARKVAREVKDLYSRNLLTAMDTIIHLCIGLYVQPDDVEQPVELDPGNSGEPVRFDERLAEILGLTESRGARDVVRKVFGNNDMAIISHAERLSRWLANTKADLTVEFWQLGE